MIEAVVSGGVPLPFPFRDRLDDYPEMKKVPSHSRASSEELTICNSVGKFNRAFIWHISFFCLYLRHRNNTLLH